MNLPKTHDPGLTRLVDRQMRNWEFARSQRLNGPRPPHEEVQDFVAVSRAVGSGGGDVARALGERLGWPVFDRQILEAMASDDDIRRKLYESMDERDLTWFEATLGGLPQGRAPQNDYFRRLTETILSLARQSRAVFLGRAAGLLLPMDRGLRVRIVAPFDQRVRDYAGRLGLSPAKAREEVERIDHERAAFVQNHFHCAAADPLRHDLIINLARWSAAQAAELILEAMRRRGLLEA